MNSLEIHHLRYMELKVPRLHQRSGSLLSIKMYYRRLKAGLALEKHNFENSYEFLTIPASSHYTLHCYYASVYNSFSKGVHNPSRTFKVER